MKTALIIILPLPVVVVAVYLLQRSSAVDLTPGGGNPYERLCGHALAVSASDLGLTVGANEPWGVQMDLPISNATATVVAFADGAASIYHSSGGGFIGGG